MTDVQCIFSQLEKIREGINTIEKLASLEPMKIQDKAMYFDKLSEMDRAVDSVMDMTRRILLYKVSPLKGK